MMGRKRRRERMLTLALSNYEGQFAVAVAELYLAYVEKGKV